MRTRLIIAGAACVAALGASTAHAETVTTDAAGTVVVTAAPGEANKLGFQASAAEDGRLTIYDSHATITTGSPACDSLNEYTVTCDWTPSVGARADLGDGDDWGYVSFDLPADARFTLAGGPGADHLQANVQGATLDGGPGDDRLDGGEGADTLLGGDGNDQLEGRQGADSLDGGAGDDLLSGDGNATPAPDRIVGGPGYDRVESDWSPPDVDAPPQSVNVTLAGGADDGRPGEGDDVSGVEKVISHAGGKLVGTDAGEWLEAFQVGSSVELDGNGGDDTLRGGDGADVVDGGAGNDDIDAGFGDDTITGGPGQDRISADRAGGDCGPIWCKFPFGNDTVYARDGERDSIACGFGTDTVYADPVDVVDADCEHVLLGGAAQGGGSGGSGGRSGTGARLALAAPSTRLARLLSHGLAIRVKAPGAGRLTATAAVRGRRVASAAKRMRRAGSATLVLHLSRQGRRQLRHAKAATFAIVVRFSAGGGAPVTSKLTVKVRR